MDSVKGQSPISVGTQPQQRKDIKQSSHEGRTFIIQTDNPDPKIQLAAQKQFIRDLASSNPALLKILKHTSGDARVIVHYDIKEIKLLSGKTSIRATLPESKSIASTQKTDKTAEQSLRPQSPLNPPNKFATPRNLRKEVTNFSLETLTLERNNLAEIIMGLGKDPSNENLISSLTKKLESVIRDLNSLKNPATAAPLRPQLKSTTAPTPQPLASKTNFNPEVPKPQLSTTKNPQDTKKELSEKIIEISKRLDEFSKIIKTKSPSEQKSIWNEAKKLREEQLRLEVKFNEIQTSNPLIASKKHSNLMLAKKTIYENLATKHSELQKAKASLRTCQRDLPILEKRWKELIIKFDKKSHEQFMKTSASISESKKTIETLTQKIGTLDREIQILTTERRNYTQTS